MSKSCQNNIPCCSLYLPITCICPSEMCPFYVHVNLVKRDIWSLFQRASSVFWSPIILLRTNKYMSSEIILETSKFYTTRPHTQTHLQAGERWTSKFKMKQLCISNRRHLIRLRFDGYGKNHCRAMTRKTVQITTRWHAMARWPCDRVITW